MTIFEAIENYIETRNVEAISSLLDVDKNAIHSVNSTGHTPLIAACIDECWICPYVDVVDTLIERGADLDAQDNLGRTALWYACHYERGEFSNPGDQESDDDGDPIAGPTETSLLDAGADPNRTDTDGLPPLHISVAHSDVGLVKLLVAKGADVNARITDTQHLAGGNMIPITSHVGVKVGVGNTPISMCHNSNEVIRKVLINNGAKT